MTEPPEFVTEPPDFAERKEPGVPFGEGDWSGANVGGFGHKSQGVRAQISRGSVNHGTNTHAKKKKSRGGSNEPPNLDSIHIHLFFLWGFDNFELLRSMSGIIFQGASHSLLRIRTN